MRVFLTILLTFITVSIFGQSVVLRNKPYRKETVELKWYISAIKTKDGVKIYRQRQGISNWELLTSDWVVGDTSLIKPLKSIDEEMSFFTDMATIDTDLDTLDGITWSNILVKSFYNQQYAQLLGIYYSDNTVKEGEKYRYQVIQNIDGEEKKIGVSKWISIGKFNNDTPIKELEINRVKDEVHFKWLMEEDRFFAVNIYRTNFENNIKREVKLNERPIMLSMIEDSTGKLTYPKEYFKDSDVKEQQFYEYTLEGIDFFGEPLKKTKPITIEIKDLTPPIPPYLLKKRKVDAQTGKVSMSWKVKEDKDRIGMNIYRSTNIEGPYVKINTKILSKKEVTYTDKVIEAGFYYYYIEAVDLAGNASKSNEIMVEVDDMIPPAVPKGLQIKADTGRFIISWNRNTEKDLRGYMVFRSAGGEHDHFVLQTSSALTEPIFYQRMPKNVKTPYAFKVVAVDSSYNRSEYSKVVKAQLPDVTPPQAPYILEVKEQAGNLTIKWQPNAEDDVTGYHLYRKESTQLNFEKWNANLIPSQSFRYIDGRAEEGNVYVYYLVAEDEAGNQSKPSEVMTGSISPKAQIGAEDMALKAVLRKKKKTSLQWNNGLLKYTNGVMVYRGNSENAMRPVSKLLKQNSWTDQLDKAGTYYYQLRAYLTTGDVLVSENIKLEIDEN